MTGGDDTTGDAGDDTGDIDDGEGDDTTGGDDVDEGDDSPGNSAANLTIDGCVIQSSKDISYVAFYTDGQEVDRDETVDGDAYNLADYANIDAIDHIHVKAGTTIEQFDINCATDDGTEGDDTTGDAGDDTGDIDDGEGDDTTEDEGDTGDQGDDTTGDTGDDTDTIDEGVEGGDTTGDAGDGMMPIDDTIGDDLGDVGDEGGEAVDQGDTLPEIEPALGPVIAPVIAAGATVAAATAPGVVPAANLPYTGAPPLALFGLMAMLMALALRFSARRTA